MGRTKTPPDQAEREAFIRVAELGANVLKTLRQPGRGFYPSERQLQQWLKTDGTSFTAADLGPALGLAEATGRLVRPAVGPNAARPGELVTSGALARDAELYANAELPEKARIDALINSIVRVLNSSGQCYEEDLGARLVGVGVVYSEEDLDVALGRLTDSGRLMLLKPKPTVECPEPSQVLVMANLGAGFAQSSDAFNVTDGLAADVHGCIKRHGDRFESDEQLETWLAEDSVMWSGHELSDAVQQLEVAGWLTRPHREREWSSGPLPGFLVSPSWARGWYS